MADAPDQTQALLALQQYASQRGGAGGSHILAMLPAEWSAGNQFSLKAMAPFNADGTIIKPAQKKPGPISKLLKDLGLNSAEIMDGMKKVAQAGAVQQASHADLFGQGGPTGSSFTSMVGGSRGGNDIEMG